MTFTKHFEEILERFNQKFHRLRILANKKWGPSPETILQIYKQCVRPIFEYGIVSTIMSQSIPTGYIPPGQPPGIRSKNCPGGRDLTFESCPGTGNSARAGILWKVQTMLNAI